MNPLDLRPTDAIWIWICDECIWSGGRNADHASDGTQAVADLFKVIVSYVIYAVIRKQEGWPAGI